jgi:hypothetical protein
VEGVRPKIQVGNVPAGEQLRDLTVGGVVPPLRFFVGVLLQERIVLPPVAAEGTAGGEAGEDQVSHE